MEPQRSSSAFKFAEDGKILVDWSDGNCPRVSTHGTVSDDHYRKFVDPTYLAQVQARVTPERDAIVPTRRRTPMPNALRALGRGASEPRRSIPARELASAHVPCAAFPPRARCRALPAGRGFPRVGRLGARELSMTAPDARGDPQVAAPARMAAHGHLFAAFITQGSRQ